MTLEEYRELLIEETHKAEKYLPDTDTYRGLRIGLARALLLLDECIIHGELGIEKDIFLIKGVINDNN